MILVGSCIRSLVAYIGRTLCILACLRNGLPLDIPQFAPLLEYIKCEECLLTTRAFDENIRDLNWNDLLNKIRPRTLRNVSFRMILCVWYVNIESSAKKPSLPLALKFHLPVFLALQALDIPDHLQDYFRSSKIRFACETCERERISRRAASELRRYPGEVVVRLLGRERRSYTYKGVRSRRIHTS